MANYKKTFDYDGDAKQFAMDLLYVSSNKYHPKKLLKMGPDKARKIFNQDLKSYGADRHFYRGQEATKIFVNLITYSFESVADDTEQNHKSYMMYVFDKRMPVPAIELNLETGDWEDLDDGGEDWEYDY